MTDEELAEMNKGTHARMDGTFETWEASEQACYWRLVNEFNCLPMFLQKQAS